MNIDSMLNDLVNNAFDFLEKAIAEVQKDDFKYSVIHFYASIELFLKARLMTEHWTLVISKRQEPDLDRFLSGAFQSVSLEEAANRLEKVVRSGLSKNELEVFRSLANNRNKMVHFFHEVNSTAKSTKLKTTVVKQQLRAWHILNMLLTKKWEEIFKKWFQKVNKIDQSFRQHKVYLDAVYENLIPEIDGRKRQGFQFMKCPSCNFTAQQHGHEKNEKEVVYLAECMVCDLKENILKIECPQCKDTVVFHNEGYATCEPCEKIFNPEDLADILIDNKKTQKGPDASCWPRGNCHECEYPQETVVSTRSGIYTCCSCLEAFDSLEACEFCGALNTGNMDDSYAVGCSMCDGKWGWEKD